jgi:uncharacterized repeat protein (TIGR01451 family)
MPPLPAARSFRQIVRNLRSEIKPRNRRRFHVETLEPRLALTGTWTALANLVPSTTANGAGTMELLSDGAVMVLGQSSQGQGNAGWHKLTPDSTGSYVNGTWTALPDMSVSRLYDATNVLPDGRVLVLGGQNSAGNPTAWLNSGEIYNPIANTWASITPFPESTFGGPTAILPDGRILAGSMNGPNTYMYNPSTNSWSPGPTKLYNDSSLYETWTKLPDGDILSYDLGDNLGAGSTEAQRLDTSTMTWGDAGTVPVVLQSSRPSIGAAVLLPDGRIFQIGGNSNTALYDPATNIWTAGPVLPGGLGGNHDPAAMLPNGHVLFAVSMTPNYTDANGNYGPVKFYEFDPAAPVNSSLTDVTPNIPILTNWPGYMTRMLVLPSGQVLFDFGGTQTYIYTPDGAPQAAWKPTISSIIANGNHFTLTGTQLNGLSAGASYGSSAEMDENYPIVELQSLSGKVYFARTFNWSSTAVATGSAPVTTDFTLPAELPLATYSLTVVTNGIASNPVSFTGGFVGADLAVSVAGPNGTSYSEGQTIPYSFTVTNLGPSAATKAVLTDTLGANLSFVSAALSQGTYKQSNGVVTASLGTIAAGATATVTVYAESLDAGNLTNTASVTSSVSDANSANNSVVNSVVVTDPPIVVSGPITVTGKNQSNVQVATFTHANGVHPASHYTATINWGDGTTSAGSITLSGTTYKVKGSHTYSTNGSHTVTTTVAEVGGSGSMSMMALVNTTTPTTSTNRSVLSATAPISQNAASAIEHPKLQIAAVDTVFSSLKSIRSRRTSAITANDNVQDDLFALN